MLRKGCWLIRIKYLLFPALAFALVFSGCRKAEEASGISEEIKDNVTGSNTGQTRPPTLNNLGETDGMILPTPTDPRGNMGERLRGFSFDLDGDGAVEEIQLYNRDDNWLLVVADGREYYPLFQGRIQSGNLYFGVWQQDKTPFISCAVISAGNAVLQNYVYDGGGKGYRVLEGFDSGGINLLYTSIPGY